MKSTIYDVEFIFDAMCQYCGDTQSNYAHLDDKIGVTMVDINTYGIPKCKDCGQNLFIYKECNIRNHY